MGGSAETCSCGIYVHFVHKFCCVLTVNYTLLLILYVSDVIHERINKKHKNLEAQPNPLLEPLLPPINTRRLNR